MGSLRKLVDGYQRFQKHYFSERGRELYKELAVGQHPDTMVIACSDSRVDPALVLDCKPGDLFVVRNVANLVPPYETGGLHHGVSAALEFAVNILEVTNIIVLGHHQCGGIKALLDDNPAHQGGFIKPWMNMAKRAADRVKAGHFATEQEKPATASWQVSCFLWKTCLPFRSFRPGWIRKSCACMAGILTLSAVKCWPMIRLKRSSPRWPRHLRRS